MLKVLKELPDWKKCIELFTTPLQKLISISYRAIKLLLLLAQEKIYLPQAIRHGFFSCPELSMGHVL